MKEDFITAIIVTLYITTTLWFALTLLGCNSPSKGEIWVEDTCAQPETSCYGKCGERKEDIECVCEYKREKGCL